MTCVGCVCMLEQSSGLLIQTENIFIGHHHHHNTIWDCQLSFPLDIISSRIDFLPLAHFFLRFALKLRRSGLIVIEGVRCKLANHQFRQFEMDDRQEVKSDKMKLKRNGKRCEKRGLKSAHLNLCRVYVYCHPLLTSYAPATFFHRFTSLSPLSKSIQEEIVTSTIRI